MNHTPAPQRCTSQETYKASLQKILANHPAIGAKKIDIDALFPPRAEPPNVTKTPHRSLAILYWDATDKEGADAFVDAMEASIKNKTYDQAFKIVVKSCDELCKLLYEKEYGGYDKDLAESHPDARITNTVVTFQNLFLEMAERDCPDVGEEHMDKQEPIVVNKKDVAKVEEKLQEMAKQHGELVLWQHQPIDQHHEAFRFAFFPRKIA